MGSLIGESGASTAWNFQGWIEGLSLDSLLVHSASNGFFWHANQRVLSQYNIAPHRKWLLLPRSENLPNTWRDVICGIPAGSIQDS